MASREPYSMRLIINGEHSYTDALREAVQAVRATGLLVESEVCREPGHAMQLAGSAAEEGVDAVVAVGGDGTLNEVINGVYAVSKSFECGIGIVPNGTANDFAARFGIPVDNPVDALGIVARGHVRHLDLGRVNGELFANVASGGFGAEVVSETSPTLKKLAGKLAYVLTGLANLTALESRPARIEGEGFTWEGDLFSVNVGNSGHAGGGLHVCPRAVLDDGLLDMLVVPDMPLRNAVQLYDEMRNGWLAESDLVLYHQSPWFHIEAPGGIQVNLDGESRTGASFHFDLLPQAMPFYTPLDA